MIRLFELSSRGASGRQLDRFDIQVHDLNGVDIGPRHRAPSQSAPVRKGSCVVTLLKYSA
jgi:hypothetical protein